MDRDISRRNALKALGVSGIAATAGCLGVLEGESEWEQQLATIEDEFGHYDQNWEAAYEDGYDPMGPIVPNMGWHFVNMEYVMNAEERGDFVIEEPAIVNFDADGNLGAIEYGAPMGSVPQSPNLFADDAPDVEEWQPHFAATHLFATDGEYVSMEDASLDQLLTNDYWTEFQPPDADISIEEEADEYWGRAILPTDLGESAAEEEQEVGTRETRTVGGVMQHNDLNALHVWAWADNPDGIFAEFNPDFSVVE